MTTVTIWHNLGTDSDGQGLGMLYGFRDGDVLAPVATYDCDDVATESAALDVAEEAFHVFNVGDDPDFGIPDGRAVSYRGACNRSLSVGDVVQVGDIWLAVEGVGFRRLTVIPTGITWDTKRVFGTTPIVLPPDQ
jgi:hypothetical protein